MYTTAVTLFVLLSTIHTISAFSTSRLVRRGLPGAYYTCTKPNFSGQCSWTQPNGDCHIQGSPNGITSLGPDEGTLCMLYSGADCKGSPVMSVRFPGVATGLPQFGSFNCTLMTSAQKKEAKAQTLLAEGDFLEDGDMRDFGLKTVDSKGREQGLIGLKKGIYY